MGALGRFFLAYVIHSLKKVVGLLAFERTGSLRREDRRKTHPDGCETAEDVGAFFPKEEPKQCPWERIAFVSVQSNSLPLLRLTEKRQKQHR